MPQSLARVLIHTVFSTKGREPVFHDPAFRSEVHAYLGGCAKALDCLPIQIGGVADHVHLLTTLSRTLAIAEFVKEIKRVSCNWIQERGGLFRQFHWQAGYGCFSVSESSVNAVTRYIERQDEHHRKITFQDEYRELLRRPRAGLGRGVCVGLKMAREPAAMDTTPLGLVLERRWVLKR